MQQTYFSVLCEQMSSLWNLNTLHYTELPTFAEMPVKL